MKKIFYIISSLLLIIIFASCVSNKSSNSEKVFDTKAVIVVNEGDPVPLKRTDGTQVGTVTAFIPTDRINIIYMSDYRLELVDEKLYTPEGILYNRYYSTHPPDRYSFSRLIEKPYIPDSTFFIKVWISDGCNFYPAYAHFQISASGGGVTTSSITVNSTRTQIVEYDWTIEKSVEPLDCLEIDPGEFETATFTVDVTRGPPQVTNEHYFVDGILEVWEQSGTTPMTILIIDLEFGYLYVPPGPAFSESFAIKPSSLPNPVSQSNLYFGSLGVPSPGDFVPLAAKQLTPSGNAIDPLNHEEYPYSWNLTGIITNPNLDYRIKATVITTIGQIEILSDSIGFLPHITEEIDEQAYVDDLIDYSGVGNFIVPPPYTLIPITLDDSMSLEYRMPILAPATCGEIGWLDNVATVTELDTGESMSASLSYCLQTPTCDTVNIASHIEADPQSVRTLSYDWEIEKTANFSVYAFPLADTRRFSYQINATKNEVSNTEHYNIEGNVDIRPDAEIEISVEAGLEYYNGTSWIILGTHLIHELQMIHSSSTVSYNFNWDVSGLIIDPTALHRITAYIYGTTALLDESNSFEFNFPSPTIIEEDAQAMIDDCFDTSEAGEFEIFPPDYYFDFPATVSESTSDYYYSIMIYSPYLYDADGWLTNTATLTELDTGEIRSDSWSIYFYTPEHLSGCVHAPWHWKEFPDSWPVTPLDYPTELASLTTNNYSEPFYLSGLSWIEVFNTYNFSHTRDYYHLAFEFIGALLNIANGCWPVTDPNSLLPPAFTSFEDLILDIHDYFLITPPGSYSPLQEWITALEYFNNGQLSISWCYYDFF